MLIVLDNFFQLHLFSRFKSTYFKNKLFCKCALLYVSIFTLPRKFLLHYFNGKGKPLSFDTKDLILKNPIVFQKLSEFLCTARDTDEKIGTLSINQTDLIDPNYKYSIGSFEINFSFRDNIIKLDSSSKYQFNKNTNRISKHLHKWLYSFAQEGNASNFEVIGHPYLIAFSDLLNINPLIKHGVRPGLINW